MSNRPPPNNADPSSATKSGTPLQDNDDACTEASFVTAPELSSHRYSHNPTSSYTANIVSSSILTEGDTPFPPVRALSVAGDRNLRPKRAKPSSSNRPNRNAPSTDMIIACNSNSPLHSNTTNTIPTTDGTNMSWFSAVAISREDQPSSMPAEESTNTAVIVASQSQRQAHLDYSTWLHMYRTKSAHYPMSLSDVCNLTSFSIDLPNVATSSSTLPRTATCTHDNIWDDNYQMERQNGTESPVQSISNTNSCAESIDIEGQQTSRNNRRHRAASAIAPPSQHHYPTPSMQARIRKKLDSIAFWKSLLLVAMIPLLSLALVLFLAWTSRSRMNRQVEQVIHKTAAFRIPENFQRHSNEALKHHGSACHRNPKITTAGHHHGSDNSASDEGSSHSQPHSHGDLSSSEQADALIGDDRGKPVRRKKQARGRKEDVQIAPSPQETTLKERKEIPSVKKAKEHPRPCGDGKNTGNTEMTPEQKAALNKEEKRKRRKERKKRKRQKLKKEGEDTDESSSEVDNRSSKDSSSSED